MCAKQTGSVPVKVIVYSFVFLSLVILTIISYGTLMSRKSSLIAYSTRNCPELREKVVLHLRDGWIDREEYDAIINESCPG